MFEHDNQAVMDDYTYRRGHAVHHGSGLYREIHKDAADKGEIGVSEIQIIIMEKLRCLLRVTSTSLFLHLPHSLKGLLNQHEDYDKGSLNDMEVSRDEECNKHHILEEQQLLGVNAADKEAGHKDDFENEDCSNLQALEDVNLTAKEDANEVNLKNQKSTDVTDVQVRELQASKEKGPTKRETKKFRVLRSLYISKNGSGFKDVVDFDKEEKLKYAFDGYTINQDLPNELMIDYSQWITERLIHVYDSLTSKSKKEPPIEIQKLAVMLPTYFSDNGFYDKTERIDWPSFEAYEGKITQQIGLVNKIPFDVDYVQNIPQQVSDSLNCGIFVFAYTEILSEGLQVHSCGFDAASQHALYASLLWHYRVEKVNEGYTSDNGDLPQPRKSVIEEIDASAIVTLE
ncbi:hypothetical protein BC332_25414 [Capsicum chinense]|nr:hypothetical protein BC332_25414 [Capsicum chinense]